MGIQILQGLSFCFPSVRGPSCTSAWIWSISAICILVLDSLSRHFSCLWWSLENFAFSLDSHSNILPVRKKMHTFWEVKWALAYTQKQSLTVAGKHRDTTGLRRASPQTKPTLRYVHAVTPSSRIIRNTQTLMHHWTTDPFHLESGFGIWAHGPFGCSYTKTCRAVPSG